MVASTASFAQYNMSTTYLGHSDLNAARYEPSELDLGDKHFQFGFNSYLWLGNTAITYENMSEMFFGAGSGDVSATVDQVIGDLKDVNVLGGGFDIQLAGLAFQIRDKAKRPYDISITVVDKFGATMEYGKNFANLFWKGNAQFAGQTVDLGHFQLNALYFREYALGAAFPIYGSRGGTKMMASGLGSDLELNTSKESPRYKWKMARPP